MATEKIDLLALDASTMQELGQEVEIDETKDAFSAPPPPPDGTYTVTVSPDPKKGFYKGTGKRGDFIGASLVLKVSAPDKPEVDGRVIFDNVNTMVFGDTCSVVGVLKALQVPVASRTTAVKLAKDLQEALQSEPSANIAGRWEGSYKDANGNYVTVVKGMANFPVDQNGVPKHIFTDPNTGQEVQAQFRVRRYDVAT